jgi:branched-chain amino acid transport system ATP-binding protein
MGGLTVAENPHMALTLHKRERAAALAQAFDIFPVLSQRRRQLAGTLSGGEQQMLSLARALMVSPSLVIADEMSMGLAPKMVDVVFESLGRARAAGVAVNDRAVRRDGPWRSRMRRARSWPHRYRGVATAG